MRINIASTHRFHLLDLARELDKQGHDVKYYSYVPSKRCAKFGLPIERSHCFLWFVAPLMLLCKLFPKNVYLKYCQIKAIDFYVARFMRPCDVFIGLGTVYLDAFKVAKAKYNAITILEWGSKHIIEQISKFKKLDDYPQGFLHRELEQYDIVDYISIAAGHVRDSFLKHGIAGNKLIVNPYGVDLEQFSPTELTGKFDIITVGGWRKEKGSDLIVEVCDKYGFSCIHVGTIVNMEFPQNTNMKHIDSVDQRIY